MVGVSVCQGIALGGGLGLRSDPVGIGLRGDSIGLSHRGDSISLGLCGDPSGLGPASAYTTIQAAKSFAQ
jgi:hypothetical protein